MCIYRLVQVDWEADLIDKSLAVKAKKAERHKAKQKSKQNVLNVTVSDGSISPQLNGNLKRQAPSTIRSAFDVSSSPATDLGLKRRCHSLPSDMFLCLTKSASSASLLDDHFWPDGPDELIE
ncbi:unnamed protein product [Echinostoma caproni]|uniref:Uncharacterized protein n=1 Tax=Echinostoma caproni TaxID=27848 RepID=A0A183AXS7_9TREM|nr:unnamed protein product [Echinostoma caproni]